MSLKSFDKICENAVLNPEKNKEIFGRKKADISLTNFDKYCEKVILGNTKDKKEVRKNELEIL